MDEVYYQHHPQEEQKKQIFSNVVPTNASANYAAMFNFENDALSTRVAVLDSRLSVDPAVETELACLVYVLKFA